jgi:2-(1,2-epoxy-1,2-dihydrophenyl)acetyl-CoA isomerase
MTNFIRVAVSDGVARLTLARPDIRNAVNPDLLAQLADAISYVVADQDVHVIVLAGDGPVFSAGGDLNGLKQSAMLTERPAEAALLAAALEPARQLLASPKPSIALIRGAAAGGGLALALACDFRIATQGSKLAYAYARIGLAGDLGATWLLTQLLGARAAFRFAMTPYLDASDARAIGLVDDVVANEALEEAGEAFVDRLLSVPPAAAAAIKANLRAAASLDFEAAGRLEAESFARLRHTADHREAIDAFLERRSPSFSNR